ncbi:MAG TPA: formate--tetrahydrofolate ligase [Euryarchaeota archaeon]|nr:MAG: formate--tetrahydrofolate ligase [Aciduliprofundum sp.]HEU12823.1 formate--tetrahydrofolate ligase [Euryarchaeota archaeon]
MELKPIVEIAKKAGLEENDIEPYGRYMAKVSLDVLKKVEKRKKGRMILVTALTPTPAGEGKTTTSIGLTMAINRLGKRSILALREPSLGPVFGVKGGATGGGKATVQPMEEINLHFTGDFHAISSAHNLLSAMINNHIYYNLKPEIDPKKVVWRRTIDMNDRALRQIIVGIGKGNGVMYEDGFDIVPASEIMAIMALSLDYKDMKSRIERILVGFSRDRTPVYARDIKASGAMSALLRNALKPNLVQTSENTPAFVHIGPFGNIAHGTNSIVADKIGLGLSDYFVTESGFGSDLGAEKFFDIVTRVGNFAPNAAVVVASIRAIKHHGGAKDVSVEDVEAVRKGFDNLRFHINNVRKFGVEPVVAINKFKSDTLGEIKALEELLEGEKVEWALSEVFEKGSEGGIELAEKVMKVADAHPEVKINYAYELDDPVEVKIEKIAKRVYGAAEVVFTKDAQDDLKLIKKIGMDKAFVCMAKTQSSITDDPKVLNAPKDFTITVREIRISSGSGFVVPILGEIMTMPGLSKEPAAYNIDLTEDGRIVGLF